MFQIHLLETQESPIPLRKFLQGLPLCQVVEALYIYQENLGMLNCSSDLIIEQSIAAAFINCALLGLPYYDLSSIQPHAYIIHLMCQLVY